MTRYLDIRPRLLSMSSSERLSTTNLPTPTPGAARDTRTPIAVGTQQTPTHGHSSCFLAECRACGHS